MEKIEILISTMNQTNYQELIKKMKIKENSVIINQVPDITVELPKESNQEPIKFFSYHEKGLSKSRNRAIEKANSDICILADDDMYYEEDMKEKVLVAYKKYPKADIIAFYVDNEDETKRKKMQKEGRLSFLKSMKISSVQITFKRKRIAEEKIKFKEKFGTGAQYNFGEENIFLAECIRKGLKIYYVPKKIATLMQDTISTWSREQTERHYHIQGAVYYEMSPKLYPFLILQFALRKRKKYINQMSTIQNLKYMFQGVKRYKEGEDL